MLNRHGEIYDFHPISENQYEFLPPNQWMRYGGKEGQEQVDYNDLGFVDPSGGPFIGIGSKIKGKEVIKISVSEKGTIILNTKDVA